MESRRNKILGRLGLAAAVSACADQQFGTHSHRICETQTLGNSLRAYKNWLLECAYGMRHVWQTLMKGVPCKWTFLLTLHHAS